MTKFNRYQNNLSLVGNNVISYTTHVATIEGNTCEVFGYWSKTTTKHINFVAAELGLKKV
jgi:hypothetical protein